MSRHHPRVARALLAASVTVVVLAAGAVPAQAEFGVRTFDGGTFGPPPPGDDPFASGPAFTQAGGHPYEGWTAFEMNRVVKSDGLLTADGGNIRNVTIDLPPGLIGNPTAVPQCPKTRRIAFTADKDRGTDPAELCAPASVVGVAFIEIAAEGGQVAHHPALVFNMEPPPGVAAQFAFNYLSAQADIFATVRANGEYAVRVQTRNAVNTVPVLGVRVALWGDPADPVHDVQRCVAISEAVIEDGIPPRCDSVLGGEPGTPFGPNPFPGHLPRKAFLTLPTSCTPPGVGVETKLNVESWDSTSAPADASFISHLPPGYHPDDESTWDPSTWGPPQGPTGCDELPFNPSFSAQPDSALADSPTGLRVNLGFPQDGLDDPEGLATAHLRDARVTLPEGMTINPSAANGLAACTDAQVGFNSVSPVQCPDASKIATVTATTPVLEEQLTGAVYIGSQLSDDPESGDMFRIVLTLQNAERGIFVKLLGKVRADADTGRLETTFQGNPQLPVSAISLRFKEGPRAPLAMPPDCGTKTVNASLSSWAGHLVQRSDSFNIACTPDLGSFAPSFEAGTMNPTGGAFSPFAVRINRPDRQGYMSGLTIEMPPGLIGKLKDVPQCPDDQAAAGTCGIESRVGTTTVGAGPGTNPFYIDGSVSLTGPYKGAPFGLSAAVRVIAGPFDLGMVVVRQAIFVDPIDAHITVVSDPLPTIVKGVPVRLRSIAVDVNRPGFTINPTSCGPKQIKATLVSTTGAVHHATQHFQAGDCQALPFRPKLAMRLTGRGQTTDGKHPGLRTVVTQAPGQANLRGRLGQAAAVAGARPGERAVGRPLRVRGRQARRLPAELDRRARDRLHPCAEQAARRAGLLRQERAHPSADGQADPHPADALDPAAWRGGDRPARDDQRDRRQAGEHVPDGPGRPGEPLRAHPERRREGHPGRGPQHLPPPQGPDRRHGIRRSERQAGRPRRAHEDAMPREEEEDEEEEGVRAQAREPQERPAAGAR